MGIINYLKRMKHIWKMCTSEQYREQTLLKEGEQIWKRLDAKLPSAEGITNKDRVRLRMFERMVQELSVEERKALNTWLTKKIKELHNEFAEHTTGADEETERRLWQIYSSHQEVVLKWV